jgi:uncharacterized membrane protein
MNKVTSTLTGMGLGAGIMYLLDPDRGRRRRALVRDQVSGSYCSSRDFLEKTSRDFTNRGHGINAVARGLFREDDPGDDVLVARIRSKIGRVVSHPHPIEVRVENGTASLEGPILESEVDSLLKAAWSVPGIKGVENRLEAHQSSEGVPALQGGARRPGTRWEIMESNWTPAVRALAGTAGGILTIMGLSRGGMMGGLYGLFGAGLLARATTNMEMKRLIGVGSGRRAIDIQKTINIHAPVEEVFAFWNNYQNFPKFMSHIREVRDLGNGKFHWTAAGPAGVPVSWEGEIIRHIPNREIEWKSCPGSAVENAGIARFDDMGDGTTRLTIRMSYNPPAGALGHAVASLFGADPRHEMNEDFIRLKSLLETGKTRVHGHTVRRDELENPATNS